MNEVTAADAPLMTSRPKKPKYAFSGQMHTTAYHAHKKRSRDEGGNDPASAAFERDRLTSNPWRDFAAEVLGHPCQSRCTPK
jgi:hypothetical protein